MLQCGIPGVENDPQNRLNAFFICNFCMAALPCPQLLFFDCPNYIPVHEANARWSGTSETGDEMSTIEMNRGYAVGGVGNVVANLFARLSAWNDTRVTRRELNRLSDRELDDIGLCRGDIERIARGF